MTYPNSALINFAGTIYVFAGGHAFGIPTPTVLNKIRAVNPAVVLNAAAGTVVPVVTARSRHADQHLRGQRERHDLRGRHRRGAARLLDA